MTQTSENAGSKPASVLTEQRDATGSGTGGLTVPPSVSYQDTLRQIVEDYGDPQTFEAAFVTMLSDQQLCAVLLHHERILPDVMRAHQTLFIGLLCIPGDGMRSTVRSLAQGRALSAIQLDLDSMALAMALETYSKKDPS